MHESHLAQNARKRRARAWEVCKAIRKGDEVPPADVRFLATAFMAADIVRRSGAARERVALYFERVQALHPPPQRGDKFLVVYQSEEAILAVYGVATFRDDLVGEGGPWFQMESWVIPVSEAILVIRLPEGPPRVYADSADSDLNAMLEILAEEACSETGSEPEAPSV